jgi:metal-dependent HD superfamily phosphatase/phosphodiesterase
VDLFDADPVPDSGERPRTVEERFAARISMAVPDRHNPRLHRLMEVVNEDDDLYALWLATNVMAVERLGMSDHGPVHVKIVMNMGVRLIRLLMDGGVEPAVVTSYGLAREDAEVVVALASLFHDLGMSIHRADHESYSLFLADGFLRELLPTIYDVRTATVMRSEVLHAIIGHRSDGRPLTVEAGVARIADALDMAKGRSRIPFEAGSVSIHSVSAAAVEQVQLTAGEAKPVRIVIELSNSAGIFQLDQLFRNKLKGSGLEPYIELEAVLEGETERRLFRSFQL